MLYKIDFDSRLLFIPTIWILCTGFGDKVYFLNEEGNKAYQEEKYQDALKKYREAQLEDPESKSILYNIGNVFYRQGNYEKALEEYNIVLHKDPSEMETDSLFNRGNALFRAAESDLRTGKLDAVKENLLTAIDSYRQVLLLNPDDRESKKTERARTKKESKPGPETIPAATRSNGGTKKSTRKSAES